MIPEQADNPTGLHRRYNVSKADGGPVDPTAAYFVLRLDANGGDPIHVKACQVAARAYVDSILRQDFRSRHLHATALELEQLVNAEASKMGEPKYAFVLKEQPTKPCISEALGQLMQVEGGEQAIFGELPEVEYQAIQPGTLGDADLEPLRLAQVKLYTSLGVPPELYNVPLAAPTAFRQAQELVQQQLADALRQVAADQLEDQFPDVPARTPEELAAIRLEVVQNWGRRHSLEADYPLPKFTCDECGFAPKCPLVFDPYNTDGDCLMEK